jgi:DNA polymerase-4
VALMLRYSDHTDILRHEPVEPGSYWEQDLMPPASRLLQRCFKRRLRVRMMTLSATRLLPPAEQCSLFESFPDSERRTRGQRLAVVMDRLRERYGNRIIRYGRTM